MIRIHFAGEDMSQSRNRLAISCGVKGDPHPYEALAEYGRDRWRPVAFEDAEVVVYALPYHEGAATRRVAEAAREAGLPCIFFRSNDDPTDIRAQLIYDVSILHIPGVYSCRFKQLMSPFDKIQNDQIGIVQRGELVTRKGLALSLENITDINEFVGSFERIGPDEELQFFILTAEPINISTPLYGQGFVV